MRSRVLLHLAAVLVALCGLMLLFGAPGEMVHAWAIVVRNHHGDLAERAIRCLPDASKLFPRNCRRERIVNEAVLYDALHRGAREPDLFDGVSSSKHSLNPRYDKAMDRAILAAYGEGIGIIIDNPTNRLPTNIVEGKAVAAIAEVQQLIETADIPFLQQLCNKPSTATQRYANFWKDLGQLSHYIADVHSPFHPNSFGLNPPGKNDDYHEGVIDPATGAWVKGLWDQRVRRSTSLGTLPRNG